MNEPYRLRYTNQIVGAFFVLVLLFVALITIVLVRANPVFDRTDRVQFRISQNELGDLYEGAEIMRLGRRAGQIGSIRYAEDRGEAVIVELRVDPDIAGQLDDRTELHVERKFGVGSPILVIRRGEGIQDQGQPDVAPVIGPDGQERSAVRFFAEVDRLDQVAAEVQSVSRSVDRIQQDLTPTLQSLKVSADKLSETLAESVDPASKQTETTMRSIEQSSEQIRPETLQTLSEFRETVAQLERQISLLTTDMRTVVNGDIPQTLSEIRDAAEESKLAAESVRTASDQTNERVETTLTEINQSARAVHRLADDSRELVQILRDEADDLPGTARRVNRTVRDAEELVEDINGHWLLRGSSRMRPGGRQVSPIIGPHGGGGFGVMP